MDIFKMTAVEMAGKIRAKEISVTEAVLAVFDNIEKQEKKDKKKKKQK